MDCQRARSSADVCTRPGRRSVGGSIEVFFQPVLEINSDDRRLRLLTFGNPGPAGFPFGKPLLSFLRGLLAQIAGKRTQDKMPRLSQRSPANRGKSELEKVASLVSRHAALDRFARLNEVALLCRFGEKFPFGPC